MSAETNSIYCNQCGLASTSDAQFCQRCGAALHIVFPEMPAKSLLQIATVQPPARRAIRYAGFWIRAVAATLDAIFLFVAFLPLRWLVGSTVTLAGDAWQMPDSETFHLSRILRIGIAVIVGLAYRAGMESSKFQATLGKMALQIKVTDLSGSRISFDRAIARYFAKFLSLATLGIGYVMAGFTPKKQALHDQLAGTLVQYK